jgi:hypothetical protein
VMARTGGPAGARLRRTDGSGERLRRRVARRASRGLTVSLPAAAQTTCQAARGRRQNTSSRPARLPRSSGRGGTHALSLPSLRRRVVRRGRALECHSRGEASKGSAVAHDWPAALAGLRAEVRTHGTPPDARQPGLPTGSVRRVWGPERVLSVWPAGSRVSDAGRKSAIDKTFNRDFPLRLSAPAFGAPVATKSTAVAQRRACARRGVLLLRRVLGQPVGLRRKLKPRITGGLGKPSAGQEFSGESWQNL